MKPPLPCGNGAVSSPHTSLTSLRLADRKKTHTLLFLVTEDWYFVSHRLDLARAAVRAGYRVLVATRVDAAADAIRKAGCEVIALPWRRRGAPGRDVRTLVNLVRLYRRERPDIVHHVALKPILFGSIAARIAGVRNVVNAVAGLGYAFTGETGRRRSVSRALRAVLRVAMRSRTSWAIMQNDDDARVLVEARVLRPEQIVMIRGSGVDLEAFPLTVPAPGTPVVMLVSRLLWDKGIGEFVEAARILREQNVLARFVVVGDADPDNPSAVGSEQLSKWSSEGIVEWWGRRSNIAEALAASHVVCLPSYREGLPKVLLEAAASGRPIVSTDVPGCRDVVRHGLNGLLVPARDAGALAAAIKRLVADPEMRLRMGREGRALVEREFALERVVAATLDLYRKIEPPGA
jgi:glycosyltransferase involved in cell wall biosynthesis